MGVTELEKGPASKTKLDVPPGYRNDVLCGKQVIGCGGGFHLECSQPHSPVARWMKEVDMALNNERQQHGNLVESSAIARVPRKGLVVWCGDSQANAGEDCARLTKPGFRRKVMRRPIALRGDTKFIPPHMLGAIVLPYTVKWGTPLLPQNGCWFRRRCSLLQRNLLYWNDRLPGLVGTNQSEISQWEKWKNFPSALPTGAECPERRSFCKSNGGPYQAQSWVPGHAWSSGGSNHHGLPETGGQFHGLRVLEKFTPIFPGERGPLFPASVVKLLQFALRASSASASA